MRRQKTLVAVFPTILSSLFSKLNGALAVAIEAERDIADISVWDPAVDAWLSEAERAWDAVTGYAAMHCVQLL